MFFFEPQNLSELKSEHFKVKSLRSKQRRAALYDSNTKKEIDSAKGDILVYTRLHC